MGQYRQAPRARELLAFLLLVFAAVGDARTHPTYDAPASTPPQFEAIAPAVSSYYRPHPSLWSRGPPEDFYRPYRPTAYPRRRPYFHGYPPPPPPYSGRPLHGPSEYDPYLDRAYRRVDGYPYTAYARPWRYHSPYLQTRYFEDLRRPPWHRPSYTYFQSAVPSFSGHVSLPSRVYYPPILPGGVHVFGVARPERRPTIAQFLVFYPAVEATHRPDLIGGQAPFEGQTRPVYQPEKPSVEVDEAMIAVEDHAAPGDADRNQTHSALTSTEAYSSTSSFEDKVVAQSEEGVASIEDGETTHAEEIDAFTSAVLSTDKPAQSASLESEIAAVTSISHGGQLSWETGEEVATESEAAAEEEHVHVAEVPGMDSAANGGTKPVTQSEEMTGESVGGGDGGLDTTPAESETVPDATTPTKEVDDDHETVSDTTTSTPTTQKAVYVQLHLLDQDGQTSTASPVTTRTSVDGVQANTSESSLIFLGLEMPREEPVDQSSQRDRIYKRYSDTKVPSQLSLDFKTVAVKPTFV